MKGISTLLLTSVAFLCVQPVSAQTEIKISKLQWEQLADMNIARMAHRILPSGNDFVVIGGHTTGFASEQSAEIFKDGAWTLLPTPFYVHDGAGAVTMEDGRTLVFGGHGGDWGTGGGVTGIDIYDPSTESFVDGGHLLKGRAMCNGVQAGGKAFMMGDYWSSSAAITVDVWSDGSQSVLDATLSKAHCYPYLMPTSDKESFLVLGNIGTRSGLSTVDKIDANTGEITQITLDIFNEWLPVWPGEATDTPDYSIGKGRYLVVCQKADDDGTYGIVLVDANAETAKLMLTLPDIILEQTIAWSGYLIVNPAVSEAYVIKSIKISSDNFSYYIATIDYNAGTVKEIAYAPELPVCNIYAGLAIMADGRIMATGGSISGESNFDGHEKVFAFTPNGGEVIDVITGIENTRTATATTSAIYNIDGQQLPQLQRGLNVVRQSNGAVKKVVVK